MAHRREDSRREGGLVGGLVQQAVERSRVNQYGPGVIMVPSFEGMMPPPEKIGDDKPGEGM